MTENQNIPPPTAEDLSRDAASDLAVCDAATAGPWEQLAYPYDFEISRPGERFTLEVAWLQDPSKASNDAAFIALARTALPAWIRRCVAAEAGAVSVNTWGLELMSKLGEFLQRVLAGDAPVTTQIRIKMEDLDVPVVHLWATVDDLDPVARCRDLKAKLMAAEEELKELKEANADAGAEAGFNDYD